jgi:hypothetical protein
MGESTIPTTVPLRRLRRARFGRRAGATAMLAFVGLGAVGLLGVRSVTARAEADGYVLEVTYPATTRPGLTSSWSASVRHPVAFSGPVTLTVPLAYLELFDFHAVHPAPTGEVSDGHEVRWTFAEPPGDRLRVRFDARTAPSVQSGAEATTRLLVDGREVARVRYVTRVMP